MWLLETTRQIGCYLTLFCFTLRHICEFYKQIAEAVINTLPQIEFLALREGYVRAWNVPEEHCSQPSATCHMIDKLLGPLARLLARRANLFCKPERADDGSYPTFEHETP